MTAEGDLIAAAKNGDRDSFAQLWRNHRVMVGSAIASFIPNRAIVEDLTSDTFLKAWTRLDQFVDNGRPFAAWLFTIARNTARDHLKRSSTRLTTCVGDLADLDALGFLPPSPSPESITVRRDAMTELERHMSRLNIPQQRSLRLRYGMDVSSKDVGVVLGISEAASKAIQRRGRVALHDRITAAGHASSDDFLGRVA